MDALQFRRREEEWMDAPGVPARDLAHSLAFIRRVNFLLGYTRATLGHLKRFSQAWQRGQRNRIVDLATGSADIPRAILKWGSARGFDLEIVAVDRHPATLEHAKALGADKRLSFVRADARDLPFEAGSFDYALTAMFIHHLDDDDTRCVLREMNRVARRGVVVADLLRDARALGWIKLLTIGSPAIIKHDAVVSVEQAYTRQEIVRLRDEAGMGYARYYKHMGYRFALAGEKS